MRTDRTLACVVAMLALWAAPSLPAGAHSPLMLCCSDDLENWEGYERGTGLNQKQDEHYPDIWQRISSGMGLGYHLHRSAVRTELDRFVRHLPSLYEMLERATPYIHYVTGEVEKRNMPLEIALLPFIESQFDPHITSEYGATGIWQFMPSTARHFKMEMSWWFDDRRDVIRATNAALDYLERLAQRFDGDWLLAVAAYNTGPARVQQIQAESVKSGQPKGFWALNLPRQTRRYVPSMIALAEVIRWGEVNGKPLPHIPNEPYFSVVQLPVQVDLLEVMRKTGLSTEEFFSLNAGFKRWAPNPDKLAQVLLPESLAGDFSRMLVEGEGPAKVNWVPHLVRPGDSLSKIAELFDCDLASLRQINGLSGSSDADLEVGVYLLVPVEASAGDILPRGGLVAMVAGEQDSVATLAKRLGVSEKQVREAANLDEGEEIAPGNRFRLVLGPEIPKTAVGKRSAYYQIRAGDTLSSIASRFDISVGELMRLNDKTSAALYPGTKIRIPLRESLHD